MHLRSQRSDCVVYSTSHQVPSMIPRPNSMLRKRLRASSGGGTSPWSEVMILHQLPLGNKRDGGSPTTTRQSKRPRFQDSFLPSTPMWKASGSLSCVEEEQSSASENSEQQCCSPRLKSADPKQLKHKPEDASDSSAVTEEAIAHEQEQPSNLDLLADCALRESRKLESTRWVFVPCLGITICTTRRPVRKAAPRKSLVFPILEINPAADEAVRSRSKRQRPVLLPSKLQDSVLLLKRKRNRRK